MRSNMNALTSVILAASCLLATGAAGQSTNPHAGHAAPAAATAAVGDLPSVKAFQAANARMHKDMSIAFTGDADVDFVRGMIPHHKGAVEMAKIVLEHGKDPEVRKLAEAVIKAQESEITWMNDWLKAKGK